IELELLASGAAADALIGLRERRPASDEAGSASNSKTANAAEASSHAKPINRGKWCERIWGVIDLVLRLMYRSA
ncbi:MAG: hypothetical protein ACREJM_11450, partial [Candidatus Saccharimonadales bacterium]